MQAGRREGRGRAVREGKVPGDAPQLLGGNRAHQSGRRVLHQLPARTCREDEATAGATGLGPDA